MYAWTLRISIFASSCVCASTVIVMPAAFIHYNLRLLSNRSVKTVSFGIDPKKLDLKLNLEQMDVKAMVSATNEAMIEDERGTRRITVEHTAHQKSVKDKTETKLKGAETVNKLHERNTNAQNYKMINVDNNIGPEMFVNDNVKEQEQQHEKEHQQEQRNIDPNDAELEQLYSHLTTTAQRDSGFEQEQEQQQEQYFRKRNTNSLRTVRGIVNAGAVHDTRSTSAAYAQRATEMKASSANDQLDGEQNFKQGTSKRCSTKYSLMDALRDCALNGNWSHSYHFFTEALDKACKAILTPVNTWNTSETKNYSLESLEESKSTQLQKELAERKCDAETNTTSPEKEKLKMNIRVQGVKDSTINQKEYEEMERERKMAQKCFRIFRGVNAALTQQQRQQAWHFYASSLVGIMRWNTGHFYMLVKVLMECHRTKELHEVWLVMKEIGIVEYMFDERSVNSFISLIRRSHNSLPYSPINAANSVESDAFLTDGTPTVSLQESNTINSLTMTNRNAQSMNDIRREMVLCLAELARCKKMKLIDANERTALTARIAAALREGEKVNSLSLVDDINRDNKTNKSISSHFGLTEVKFVSTSEVASDGASTSDDTESAIASLEGKLTVNDFNTLLRQAHSDESTERLVRLMKKLHITLDASSYASIINSLHSPLYKLSNDECEDNGQINTRIISNNNINSGDSTCEDDNDEAQWQTSNAYETSKENDEINDKMKDDNSDAKLQYEAHKDRRITYARRWFNACPEEMRSANVYNEMLYLLRAKRHIEEFNKLLITLRGNTVRIDDRWLHLQLSLETRNSTNSQSKSEISENQLVYEEINQEGKETTQINESSVHEGVDVCANSTPKAPLSSNIIEQEAQILPADWKIQPNNNTYELLVQRARYLHDWSAMWQLYVEMKQVNVSGTARLYQILLEEAEKHPPRTRRGELVDSGTLVLQLYEEMREKKLESNSLSSTVSLVRAWSGSLQRRHRSR